MNIARFPVLLSLLALGAACGDDEGNNPPRGTCTVDEGTPALPPNPPPTPTGNPILVAQVPIPDDYGIHDTFVRDGLAFVLAWDTGLMIYDVGHGVRGERLRYRFSYQQQPQSMEMRTTGGGFTALEEKSATSSLVKKRPRASDLRRPATFTSSISRICVIRLRSRRTT